MQLLLTFANLVLPVAVLVFASGFFPHKPFLPGLASHKDLALDHGSQNTPSAKFDRVIFMVIDALRSDFIFSSSSGFAFTQKLVRDGIAVPFTGIARPPTVTMPRVKAMTTGSIPSFLDVILNFAESDTSSTLAHQDTWLAQIRAGPDGANTGKLIMYGDDTWLKLFPDMFTRADGTSSFFVSDFTEVDQNVTRHVPTELLRDDWNAMILHYLGLDHIGHKAGPTSPNMVPKHMEMDGVVRQIYDAISNLKHLESTLFILCGDHGMNDGGNHGGSAPGETETALLFMSPKLKPLSPSGRKCPVTPKNGFEFYKKVEQSDLAPTISGLMGLPIPRNNLGVFIPEFLELWKDPNDRLQVLLRNALQILTIVKAQFPGLSFDNVDNASDCDIADHPLVCEWKTASRMIREYRESGGSASPVLFHLHKFCKDAQDVMSSTASNYDVPRLVIGTALTLLSFLAISFYIFQEAKLFNIDTFVFFIIVTGYGAMMFASSYVEEEQQFWYWISAGWVAYIRCRSIQKSESKAILDSSSIQTASIIVLLFNRIIQRWNQTGQKHSGAPDIVSDYLLTQPIFMWSIVALTYTFTSLRIAQTISNFFNVNFAIGSVSAGLLTIPSMIFKIGFTSADAPELFYWLQGEEVEWLQQLPLILTARIIFATLAFHVIVILVKTFISSPNLRSKSYNSLIPALHSLLSLLLLTQSRTTNIPLFLFFHLQLFALSSLSLSPSQISMTTFILAQTSFYALGNSNAISSVDLSNSYNGVAGYNVLAVGVLLFISNWAGPIWWAVGAMVLFVGQQTGPEKKRAWVKAERELLAGEVLSKEQAEKIALDSQPKSDAGLKDSYLTYFSLATLFTSGSLLAVQMACTALRTHLFIWTVFSPKYLYSMAWTLGYHFLVNLGLNGSLWYLRS